MNNQQQAVARFEQICDNCQVPTQLVEDHAAGDLVCSECGLVLEARAIDESTEWRTFSNNESTGQDRVRADGSTNPLLKDGGLSTVVGKGDSNGALSTQLTRLQNRGSNPDRALIAAFGAIAEMADRLGLVPTIKDRANELFRDISELKSIRGRSASAIQAACLYIACRQEDKPRTFKEICAVARDTNTREIGRCFKFILKGLGSANGTIQNEMNQHALKPGDLLRRYCSTLALPNDVIRAIVLAVEKFLEMREVASYSHKSQNSVAAAGIYLMTYTLDEESKADLKSISQVAGVAEQTIKMSYDDMYPHRAALFSNLPRAFMERLPANFDAMLPKPRESPALAGSPLLALASGLPAAAAPVPALTGSQLG